MMHDFRARRAPWSAAARCRFLNLPKILVFYVLLESGSKLPHSESFASEKSCGIESHG
jgi:hypothetical protein